MKNSLIVLLSLAVHLLFLCSSVKTESGEDNSTIGVLQSIFFNSLRDIYLREWNSEIHDSKSVLVFPAAVLQEFLLEHALRMPDGSPEKAKLAKALPFDTGLPFALDLSSIDVKPLQQLSIQTFYTNKTPDMNQTIEDPNYFSYKAFMEWAKLRLDAVGNSTDSPINPLLTVASLRISSIQSDRFTFVDKINFHVSKTQTVGAFALRNVGKYDYAEFSYPRLINCTAGALRLQINDDASIIFIIALNVSDAQCSSSENLLKILEDKTVETINFTPKYMFISIPSFRVSTIVWPERKLIQLGLLSPKPSGEEEQATQMFADHYESASLIFNPEVPADAPMPMIHPSTPKFEVDRPFLVEVIQKQNPVPAFVGLIQNPTVDFECCSAPLEPPQIVLTYKNKGRRPNGQNKRRSTKRSITTEAQNNRGSD